MTKKENFEEALITLQQIAEQFESGDMSLDEMIKKYEEGTKLAEFCLNKLEVAENKIKTLNENGLLENANDLDLT